MDNLLEALAKGMNVSIDGISELLGSIKDNTPQLYAQLEERVAKLNSFIIKYNKGELDVELDCPLWVLELQLNAMNTYLTVLKKRIGLGGGIYEV